MKQNEEKIQFIFKIVLLVTILGASIYLKMSNFLESIHFNNMEILLNDRTDFIIEFNIFSNLLIIFALIILIFYCGIYKIYKKGQLLCGYDTVFLIYFSLNFIILLVTKYIGSYDGQLSQISILLSSLTFLQTHFLRVIPYGIIIYIPLLYVLFIKKRQS